MKLRGSSMTVYVVFAVVCVATLLGSLWVYNKREDTVYDNTWSEIHKANSNYAESKMKFDESVRTMQAAQARIESLEKMVEHMNKNCNAVHAENTATMKKCADLELKQIELQDKLSRKRPVITLSQPIAVEVTKGSGVKALIKESGKKAKELGQ